VAALTQFPAALELRDQEHRPLSCVGSTDDLTAELQRELPPGSYWLVLDATDLSEGLRDHLVRTEHDLLLESGASVRGGYQLTVQWSETVDAMD
jgi:hypothetical protein